MEIRSFSEIVITPQRTLILCDIDDTLLKWDLTLEACFIDAITLFPTETEDFQRNFARNIWLTNREMAPPSWTDQKGFINMLTNLSPCSRLVFLTARAGGELADWTRRDFESLGLVYDPSGVFYTGNRVTKGTFIKDHIPLEGFEKVIFIDDLQENIDSVSAAFPQIQCYLWKRP
jgi:hypothetical protein